MQWLGPDKQAPCRSSETTLADGNGMPSVLRLYSPGQSQATRRCSTLHHRCVRGNTVLPFCSPAGYSLTFTRTLQKTEYRLEGVAAITSQSAGSTPLLSVNIIADGKEVQAPCQGMPASRYDLPPGMVVECPFAVAWTEDPGAATVSGYIQTTFGRAPAAGSPVPYSFTSCGSASGDGNSAASCTVVENVACVSVTDGAFIINK